MEKEEYLRHRKDWIQRKLSSDAFVLLSNIYIDSLENTKNNKHSELLYAVESKFKNESRHKTALRYITQREKSTNSVARCEN